MQDRLLHVDMLDVLMRGVGRVLYAAEDGVLLYNAPGWAFNMSCKTEGCANRMAELISSYPEKLAYMVILHQPEYESIVRQAGYGGETEPCLHAAYFGHEHMAGDGGRFDIRRLGHEHEEFVKLHYGYISEDSYLTLCIDNGMYGAFDGESMMGFIGTHAEGCMGLLHVLPEYRQRGVGQALEAHLANLRLDAGLIPYGQVWVTNDISRNLQHKAGYEVSSKPLLLMFRPEAETVKLDYHA